MLNKRTLTLMAALATAATTALAQTPPPAHKPGLLSRLLHHSTTTLAPGATMHRTFLPLHQPAPGATMMHGQIIGNKKSHVYHLPGQPGALPAPQNRVYFSSAAAAQAAGYYAMGSSHSSGTHHAKR